MHPPEVVDGARAGLPRLFETWGTAVADQVVVSATTFATGIIVGRTCSKEDFGLFALAFSVLLFCSAVEISLISAPYIVRRPLLSGVSLERYTGNTMLYLTALCVLASSMTMLVFRLAARWEVRTDIDRVALTLAGVVALQLFKEYARHMCFARMDMGSALAVDGVAGAIQVGGLLALAAAGGVTPSSALAAIGLATGVAVIGWLIRSRGSFRPHLSAALQFDEHWQLARLVLASGMVYALTMGLYPWIVAWGSGTTGVAVWAACFAVAGLINPFLMGTQNFLGPRLANSFAEEGPKGLRRLSLETSLGFSALVLPYAAVLWWIGDRLVAICFGDGYAGQGHLVALLGAALLLGAAGFSFSRAFLSISRAELDLLANGVALLILLTAGSWAARSAGPLGVATVMLAANATTFLGKGATFLRVVRPPLGVAMS